MAPLPPPRRRARLRASIIAVSAALGLASCLARPGRAPERVADVIAARLDPSAATSDSLERALRRFYADRGHRPAWSDGRRPGATAAACAAVLGRAAREGLDPSAYHGATLALACARLRQMWPAPPPDSLAALDLALTRGFLHYARDAHQGRVPETALDPDWVAARPAFDPLAPLREAMHPGRTESVMAGLGPGDPGSVALRAALGGLLDLDAAGGWPRLLPGGVLRAGDRGDAVARLRRRLAHEAALDTSDLAAPFDAALTGAMRAYQRRYGLPATGRLDAPTRAALEVPAAVRARAVALNLERRRWMRLPLSEPCIAVNLPDFTLELRDSGRTVLRMRVVVGERRNPTPVFSDAVTYLEFNPVWRVPRRIVAEEIAPAQLRDTSYLARQQMRVYETGTRALAEVPHPTVDWRAAASDSFPYRVAQDGGAKNPLGRMKFMCPNEHDVYLHDTPMRSHFAAEVRARSHGCVRLQQPHALAERLLAPRFADAVADSVDSLVAAAIPRRIGLERAMPVHLLYWTAWVDSAGALQFREDLYGVDERLEGALRGRRPAEFVLNPPVEWSTPGGTPPSVLAARRR